MFLLQCLLSWLSHDLYLQLYRDRIIVRNMSTHSVREYPTSENPQQESAFAPSRVLFADMKKAEEVFATILRDEHGGSRLVYPQVFVQNHIPLEGGMTDIESFGLVTCLERAGARKVCILDSTTPLNEEQIAELSTQVFE